MQEIDWENDELRLVQDKSAKINAYEYKGKCWLIDSVQSYFRFNMEILDPKLRKGLFRDELPVFTKVRDEMPACYGDKHKPSIVKPIFDNARIRSIGIVD